MNPALRAILKAGGPVLPILDVEWAIRGHDLGAERYAGSGVLFQDRAVSGLTTPNAGFSEIKYGAGMRGTALQVARTAVSLQPNSRLVRKLETFDPHGSASALYWASPNLVRADWQLLHAGVVEDWRITPAGLTILLKTDDGVLQAQSPKPFFSKADTSSADDPSIWGVSMPLVLGAHSGFEITGRGAIICPSIRYNDLLGHWYCASVGSVQVLRVYIDGQQVAATNFSAEIQMFGGSQMTIVKFPLGGQPERNAVVTCDLRGPDANGLLLGSVLKNPLAQLRAYLNNYVYRDHRYGQWNATDVPQIDSTSWNAVEDYFDLHGYESSLKIGGLRGDFQTAQATVSRMLDSYPWLRIQWTESGALTVFVVDPADQDPVGNWVRADVVCGGDAGFVYAPGDRREVYDRVTVPFLGSDSEGKAMSTHEVHDLTLRYPKNALTVENLFSQATYLSA